MEQLKQNIIKLDKRLKWDEYFMTIALLVSKRSSCHRLHVGCILVQNNRIISSGYNGHLPNTKHRSVIRNNHEQMIVHAEVNSIIDCAKRNISTNNATAYVTHYPCLNCFKTLISGGIKKIIYNENYKNDLLVKDLSDELNIVMIHLIL
jgi:dCMP deaminase